MGDLNIDDFLGHQTNSSNGGARNRLEKWKDRSPPVVDFWLSRKARIASLWQHVIPNIYISNRKDDPDKGKKKLGISSIVCWEPEDILKEQYKKDDDGRRVSLPTCCPIDFMVEWVRREVYTGNLDILAPVFKYEDQCGNKLVVRAGHLFNGFDKAIENDDEKDPEKSVKGRMNKLKVYLKDAWKHNMFAKAHYIFTGVDDSAIAKGVVTTVEPALLGDKVKGLIRATMESLGEEDGNPLKTPYAIRFKHLPNEQEFGKRYAAIRMEKLKCTPELKKLLNAEAPSIEHLTKPFDHKDVLTGLESACVLKTMPWKDIHAFANKGMKTRPSSSSKSAPAEEADEDIDGEECQECHEMMPSDSLKCPHCGAEYEDEEEEVKPKKKAKPEAEKVKKKADSVKPKKKAKPEPEESEDEESEDEEESEEEETPKKKTKPVKKDAKPKKKASSEEDDEIPF